MVRIVPPTTEINHQCQVYSESLTKSKEIFKSFFWGSRNNQGELVNVSYSVFNHVISQNGYTRYPNYLLKSLKKLTPLHRAIMIEIHEYTFSHFKSDSKLKTTAKIDRAELALRCCVSQKTIKRGLKYLVELNYIEVTKEKFNSVILSVKNLIMDSFFRDALESRIEETNESDTTQKTENIIKTDNVSGKMDNLSGKKDNLSEFSSIPNNFTDTFSDSSKQDCVKSNKNENSKNFNLGLLGKIGGKRLTQSRANYLLNKYGLTNTSLQDLIDAFNRELRASNINGSEPI